MLGSLVPKDPTLVGGMYTNTNPELRRVVPEVHGRTKVKVVYVVLEAQYQSALTTAVKNINAKRSNVSPANSSLCRWLHSEYMLSRY